jgi:hypothetical protein
MPARIDTPELLDMDGGSDEDVKANFADMWRINRYLGGVQALTQHLYPRLLAQEGTTTLVDIGTGAGDIGAVISEWACRRGLNLNLWGLDLSARNLRLTRLLANANPHPPAPTLAIFAGSVRQQPLHREGEKIQKILRGKKHSPTASLMRNVSNVPFDTRLQADALRLPFKAGSVDYYISSLFLHHLSPDKLKTLLATTFQAANKGIIMSDLTRGWLPQMAFKLGQPIFARNFLTRHDGLVSIRRAYTPDELLTLAREAGLPKAHIYRHWGWRMTLVVEK